MRLINVIIGTIFLLVLGAFLFGFLTTMTGNGLIGLVPAIACALLIKYIWSRRQRT